MAVGRSDMVRQSCWEVCKSSENETNFSSHGTRIEEYGNRTETNGIFHLLLASRPGQARTATAAAEQARDKGGGERRVIITADLFRSPCQLLSESHFFAI